MAAALLAMAWRKVPTSDPLVLAALPGLALLAADLMLWRSRSRPPWPSSRRAC